MIYLKSAFILAKQTRRKAGFVNTHLKGILIIPK